MTLIAARWLLLLLLGVGMAWGQEGERLMTEEERDARPLPRYTSASALRDVLVGQDWSRCLARPADAVDQTITVRLQVRGDGVADGLGVSGAATAAVAACVEAVVRAAPWPRHDEVPLSVAWTLGVRAGQPIPYPAVQVPEREVQPLFLFVPPDASPEARAALRAALGLETSPEAATGAAVPGVPPDERDR